MILQILARCGAFFIGFIVKGQMNHDFAFGIEVNPCVIEITIGKAKDLASMNAGSAVPSMTTDILNAMEVVIPSASALEEFESLVAPMYEAMEANDVQSKALSQMRDTLLPKLMSGEIDVSDIQL